MIFYPVHILTSFVASVLRLGAGKGGDAISIETPLILYEFEGCPFCRIAREAISSAGVPTIVRPCPKGGKRYRPQVRELGGKGQFPYLIDPNTNVAMYESADIARYLRKTYGAGRPFIHWLGPLNILLSQFGVIARLGAGTFVSSSTLPATPLEFEGAERNPAARLVKERLCAMEISYLWRPGSAEPSLSDPQTGERVTGVGAMCSYLKRTYGV